MSKSFSSYPKTNKNEHKIRVPLAFFKHMTPLTTICRHIVVARSHYSIQITEEIRKKITKRLCKGTQSNRYISCWTRMFTQRIKPNQGFFHILFFYNNTKKIFIQLLIYSYKKNIKLNTNNNNIKIRKIRNSSNAYSWKAHRSVISLNNTKHSTNKAIN